MADDYLPPSGKSVALNFTLDYDPPQGNSAGLEFSQSAVVGETQYIFPIPHDSLASGGVDIKNYRRFVYAHSIASKLAYGKPGAVNYRFIAYPPSFVLLATGKPKLNRTVKPAGHDSAFVEAPFRTGALAPEIKLEGANFDSTEIGLGLISLADPRLTVKNGIKSDSYGKPTVYNSDTYLLGKGLASSTKYGLPSIYLRDKFVTVPSFATMRIGAAWASHQLRTLDVFNSPNTCVIPNTHWLSFNNRVIAPAGLDRLNFGGCSFSYRQFLFASGHNSMAIGEGLRALQFGNLLAYGVPPIDPPTPRAARSPRLKGFDSFAFGKGSIESSLRTITLHDKGIAPPELSAFLAIKDRRIFAYGQGFDNAGFGVWTEISNKNRPLGLYGFDGNRYGYTVVYNHDNKPPQRRVYGHGRLSQDMGTPAIGDRVRGIHTKAITSVLGYGRPYIYNSQGKPFPVGFLSQAIGYPRLNLALPQTLKHGGSSYYAFGNPPTIWARNQIVRGIGSLMQAFGTNWLSRDVRSVEGAGAGNRMILGQSNWVSFSPRKVSPVSIAAIGIPESHTIEKNRTIEPFGFDSTRFGDRVRPDKTAVYGSGFFSQHFGQAKFEHHTNYITPNGVFEAYEHRIGRAYLYNLRQYLLVENDNEAGGGGFDPVFGKWLTIKNKDAVLGAFGFISDRHGYSQILNKAMPVLPASIAPPSNSEHYKAGRVSNYQNFLMPQGFDVATSSRWHLVLNGARVIGAQGFDSQAHGNAELLNLTRQYRYVTMGDSSIIGSGQMISHGIRALSFEGRYSINPPIIRLPTVFLWQRYVQDVGLGDRGSRFGNPALSIFWRRITPRWTFEPSREIGIPALKNLRPEIGARGADAQEFGDAFLRTKWREVIGHGLGSNIFGGLTIKDRRIFANVPSIAPPITGKPKLERIGGRPDNQHATPPAIDSLRMSNGHYVGAQEAYPSSISDGMRLGQPYLLNNGIILRFQKPMLEFGWASISIKNRRLTVGGIARREDNVGRPRQSTHTIYAVIESPSQARANHPLPHNWVFDYVRGFIGFGWATVTNQHRRIWAYGIGVPEQSYRHDLTEINFTRWIRPEGKSFMRQGVQRIPTPPFAKHFNASSTMAFGTTKLSRPPYTGPQWLSAKGSSSMTIGGFRVELFRRELIGAGHSSMAMGTRKAGDTPYPWQGLRIGELVPYKPVGFDSLRMGSGIGISYRVRELVTEGLDFFALDYTLGSFGSSLKVKRYDKETDVTQIAKPYGVASSNKIGIASVVLAAHYIRPDGNSDVYRKGGGIT